jgi:CubicO group peptidase (beta-lactamase class C family)
MARSPEEVGISSAQLARIEEVTKENIKAGLVPGAVILVQRKGKVAWFTALGDRDRAGGSPMRTDSIFRIYSMTKPIVSVVIMMLVEEGRMQIYDPVSKYLPEMAGMKVGVEKTDASGKATLELVAPEREMTIQDLLRHTSGLIYGSRGKSLVNQAYIDAKILDRSVDSKEFVTRVSKLPLRFSPGTRWEYGISVDVLGRVIEVVEGRSLGQVLKARIFDPLGMVDTAFYVPPEKMDRAAQPWPRPGAPPSPRFDVAQNPAFESGGGGLVSTAEDYLRFTQMLLNGGEHNGQRFIGRKMVEFMTSDHTPNLPGRNPSVGFGLGFDVRNTVGATGIPGSVGEYSWAGNAGTMFWIDPKEELIAIFMVQVADGDRIAVRNQFRSMLQSAIRR